jgi:glycosyltransferase involved in cell wall biosynthesis
MKRLIPVLEIITVVKDDIDAFLITQMSLAVQETKSFKWVIVDGSRTEKISNAIDYSVAASVEYKWVEPNGIYNAMNYGLSQSTSDWIWYINAGDHLSNPEAISTVNELFAKYPRIDALGLTVHHIDKFKYTWGISRPAIQRDKVSGLAMANINHQGFLATRESLIEAGYFDESLFHVADTKIMDWVATNRRVSCMDYHAVNFIIGGHSNLNLRNSINELKEIRGLEISVGSKILDSLLVLKNSVRMYASSHQNLISFLIKALRDPKTMLNQILNSSPSEH